MFDSTQTANPTQAAPLSERETVLLAPAPLAPIGRRGAGSTLVLCSPLGASGSGSWSGDWELVEELVPRQPTQEEREAVERRQALLARMREVAFLARERRERENERRERENEREKRLALLASVTTGWLLGAAGGAAFVAVAFVLTRVL